MEDKEKAQKEELEKLEMENDDLIFKEDKLFNEEE